MIHTSWLPVLEEEFGDQYFEDLMEFVSKERNSRKIYPPEDDVFNAFRVPVENVKAVILGQDPYHAPGQAHGLAFSVPLGVKIPPSLLNIYKELESDLGIPKPNHGCLESWVDQGVLLLNTTMTVRQGEPGSHQKRGWEIFTDKIIQELSNKGKISFILWGSYARSKAKLIDSEKNLVIQSAHPSPLSARRGFFGSKPFSRTNDFLDEVSSKINWSL